MSSQEITDHIKTETFEFTGRRGPFFKLLLINLFLTIITLGIYRFWAKTNVRRFIWLNIRFMGDPLEYTGKGSELLLGFLIVLAVLFPLGLIYEGIQSLTPPEATTLHIGLEALYYIIIFALIQIGFYRAWRYRMSRTAWRGIRLGLDGSTWTFLKLSLGWSVLTVLTLGIAYPWMAIELWRYQIMHTRIGKTVAQFKGNGRELLLPWLFVMTPGLILLMINLIYSYSFYQSLETTSAQPSPNLEGSPLEVFQIETIPAWFAAMNITALVALAIGWFHFSILITRYQISSIRFGEASFHSRLPIGRLFAYAAIAIGVIAFPAALLMFSLVTGIGSGLGSVFLSLIPLLIFAFLIAPIAWTLIFKFELIKQVFVTTTITNPEVLQRVVQSASESQRTGEGLADALDIGGL